MQESKLNSIDITMEYKVVPFTATLSQKLLTAGSVATQLEDLIRKYSLEGWQYERLESVSTYIQPDNGCFGLGAKPGYMSSYQMVVFSKLDNAVFPDHGN